MLGLLLTVGLTWAARAAHEENEDRLLRQQAFEVAAVLTAAVPSIEGPLVTSAALVAVEADPQIFRTVMGTQVGPDKRFASASVWTASDAEIVAVIGDDPLLGSQPSEVRQAFFDRSLGTGLVSVLDLSEAASPRLGYSFTSSEGPSDYLIYAEQALPADRTTSLQADSAFSELDYALYLDTEAQATPSLLLASTDDLPLAGRVAEQDTAFGDSTLRLVVSPTGNLGGNLLARLFLVVLAAGTAMTLAATALTQHIQRRRVTAEALASENALLYAEQRTASMTLQQSLLPAELPHPIGVEIAAHYAPGVRGTGVGGDWYDVLDLGERIVLVVGDVSGRGLGAASVMAAVRHSVRAFASQGHAPNDVLDKIGHPGLIDLQGHFVTVLCAVVDLAEHSVTVASAGHPPPLVATDETSAYLEVAVGPPIGARTAAAYEARVSQLRRGSRLLLFTDGVFERRGETIDVGLERLRNAAGPPAGSLQAWVERLTTDLGIGAGQDDAAILAVRWGN